MSSYRALNPQGKIPVLVLPDGEALYESRVISAYLAEKYGAGAGPGVVPSTPEAPASCTASCITPAKNPLSSYLIQLGAREKYD